MTEAGHFPESERLDHPVGRSVYDWIALVLLLLAPVAGPIAFGAVRVWSFGPLIVFGAVAALMVFLRPVFSPDFRSLRIPPGWFLFFVFWLYGLALMPFAAVPYEARVECLRGAGYLAAYWAWTELAGSRGRWKMLLGLVIFSVTLIAWYAIIQHVHGSRMVLNLVRPESYEMRASGTYFCPNHFAHLLELVIPMCLVLLFIRGAGYPLRILAGYALLVTLPALQLTQSRAGWLGILAGVPVTICFLALRKNRRLFGLALVLMPLLAAGAAALLWFYSPAFHERFLLAVEELQTMQGFRVNIWRDTLAMIRPEPILGHGPGSYRWLIELYRTHFLDSGREAIYAHNEVLHVWAEYGAVGLGLVLLAGGWAFIRLAVLVVTAQRDRNAFLAAGLLGALAATLVHQLFDFNLHIFANVQVLIVLAGVVSAKMFAEGDLRARTLPGAWGVTVYGAASIAAAALALAALQAVVSHSLQLVGDQRASVLKVDDAERILRRAVRIDPGNWRPYGSLGTLFKSRAVWVLDADYKRELTEQSMTWYREALRRNPYDMINAYGLGMDYLKMGDAAKGLDYLREAADKNPHNLAFRSHLGLQLRFLGRYEEALAEFQRAAALGSTNDMVTLNLQWLGAKIAEQNAAQTNGAAAP